MTHQTWLPHFNLKGAFLANLSKITLYLFANPALFFLCITFLQLYSLFIYLSLLPPLECKLPEAGPLAKIYQVLSKKWLDGFERRLLVTCIPALLSPAQLGSFLQLPLSANCWSLPTLTSDSDPIRQCKHKANVICSFFYPFIHPKEGKR